MPPLRIVVTGYAGLLPAGGVAWDYLQYPLGFRAMGHDAWYIEDTQLWPVYQQDGGVSAAANIAWLSEVAPQFGLADRWAYRDEMTGSWHGATASTVHDVLRTADLLVNVSCATPLRAEYAQIPVRVLIDTDPMFTQWQHLQSSGFTLGARGLADAVAGHTHHFSFGESIGQPGCRVPDDGVAWQPTRQPIVMQRWSALPPVDPSQALLTTVLNWSATAPFEFDGDTWGQKDRELQRFLTLATRVPQATFRLAVGQTGGTTLPRETLSTAGFSLSDAASTVATPAAYQAFIAQSTAEWSIAKETYVKAHTGWFSCRSACYLAAGRPIIAQDTGWSAHIPAGAGAFAFRSVDEAIIAIDAVLGNPVAHGLQARELAHAYFDSTVVLSRLLHAVGL
jgi:hypothetical protein